MFPTIVLKYIDLDEIVFNLFLLKQGHTPRAFVAELGKTGLVSHDS